MIKAFDDNSGHGADSPTVTDLSELATGFPAFGASMAGQNSISTTPAFGAPGSGSEAASLVDSDAVHDFGDASTPSAYPGDATDFSPANTKAS